jgi:hypothetical protein
VALPRFILIFTLSMLVFYGLCASATSVVFRLFGLEKRLDTGSLASDAFFGVQGASAVVYNRLPLNWAGPQVILVGASNMQHYSARDIAVELPDVAVNNMSVAGSDLQDFGLVVDLAYQALPAASQRKHVFVFGLWYGEFLAIHGQGAGAIDPELIRYGLYRKDGADHALPMVPESLLQVALFALRPLILQQRAWGTLTSVANSGTRRVLGDESPPARDIFAEDQVDLGEQEKHALIELRKSASSRIADDALDELTAIAKRISNSGDRLVLVDLPIPQWHATAVPAYADYFERRKSYFATLLRLPGVEYVNMQGDVPDEDFYDSVHPKPSAGVRLAHHLGRTLAGLLAPEAQAGAH